MCIEILLQMLNYQAPVRDTSTQYLTDTPDLKHKKPKKLPPQILSTWHMRFDILDMAVNRNILEEKHSDATFCHI